MSSSATLTPVLIQKARDALALGQAHLQEKRPQQALALFQQVARICPDVPAIYGLIGDALDQLGHRKEAGQWYKQSLTMDPSQLAVWNNFGNSLRFQSRYREAITAYESALELAADHPVVWKNLGLSTSTNYSRRQARNG